MSERKSVGSSSTSTNVALEQNLVLASSTKGLALVEVCIILCLLHLTLSFLVLPGFFFSLDLDPASVIVFPLQVIKQVLSNPYIFAFGDFLAIPNVKQVRSFRVIHSHVYLCPCQLDGTEHAPYLRVLQLFAYGVYSEYKGSPCLVVLCPCDVSPVSALPSSRVCRHTQLHKRPIQR